MADVARTVNGVETLTEREREILLFERGWWRYSGARAEAVRGRFGCSMNRYLQELNGIIDKPSALMLDPMVVKRLRRLREDRARARTGSR